MSVLNGILTCIWGCDPGAERRARAIREVIIAATEERAAEAIEAAEAEARHTALAAERERQNAIARLEAHLYARTETAQALTRAAEVSARRKRVLEGMRRLHEALPEPDLNARLECQRYKYPCSLLDVPKETRTRSFEIGNEISALMRTDADLDEAYEWLLEQDDIVDVRRFGSSIMYQVKGGQPMGVMLKRLGGGRADP